MGLAIVLFSNIQICPENMWALGQYNVHVHARPHAHTQISEKSKGQELCHKQTTEKQCKTSNHSSATKLEPVQKDPELSVFNCCWWLRLSHAWQCVCHTASCLCSFLSAFTPGDRALLFWPCWKVGRGKGERKLNSCKPSQNRRGQTSKGTRPESSKHNQLLLSCFFFKK